MLNSGPNLMWITPEFAVTSVLAPDDFSALAAQGFTAVISNLPDDEDTAQMTAKSEATHAWRAGLVFRHVPATKHDLFTDVVVEGMGDALRTLKGPVIAHCKSGLRSAIIWAAASARSQPVDCVLAALEKAGFDLEVIRDDLDAQADRKRWLGVASALDCNAVPTSAIADLTQARNAA